MNHIKLFEEFTNKKNIYILVGPPSVGKSTWISKRFEHIKPFVISRDNIVDEIANEYGFTYDDMFHRPDEGSKLGDVDPKFGTIIKTPNTKVDDVEFSHLIYDNVWKANVQVFRILRDQILEARGKDNIVIDMTNMTPSERKKSLKIIKGIEDEYNKIAVVFNFKGIEDIIKKVNKKRSEEIKARGGTKTIPEYVYDRLFSIYQDVKLEEGFDRIEYVDNTEILKRIVQNENITIKRFLNFNYKY